MTEQFQAVQIQDHHIQSFNRNKPKIAQFYKLDQRSLKLVQVGQKPDDSIHSFCQFVVQDKNNKTATLKLDCLRTKTKLTGQQQK